MAATVSYLFPSPDGILVIAMLGVDAFGDRPQPASTRNGARRNACLHALTVTIRQGMDQQCRLVSIRVGKATDSCFLMVRRDS
jgi:hypothetical protein